MKIRNVLWKEKFMQKLRFKHNILPKEVEEALFRKPFIVKIANGRVKHEHVYEAFGRTDKGRYIVVFFIRKAKGLALPISARDMTKRERAYYEKNR